MSQVTKYLSKLIAKDGEGATKLLECIVTGAADIESARIIAKTIIDSPLVKSAMFGEDANWGRILCAIGYAGVPVDVDKVALSFSSTVGEIVVCENGRGIAFDEDHAKSVFSANEIMINITLEDGFAAATAWGCDLTYDYVRINGDYRT
jgi:glutamate N-acetyltransferase/amino-acid N-acetyltransferase